MQSLFCIPRAPFPEKTLCTPRPPAGMLRVRLLISPPPWGPCPRPPCPRGTFRWLLQLPPAPSRVLLGPGVLTLFPWRTWTPGFFFLPSAQLAR